MALIFIRIILFALIVYFSVKTYLLKKDMESFIKSIKEQNEIKPFNFSIKYKGKEYWISRSVTTELYAFAKDNEGNWCVLANKRGKGCPNANGLWNVPSGYLDYNETAEHRAIAECYEECGIEIDEKQIKLVDVDSTPLSKKQNVKLRYFYQFPSTIENYNLTNEYSEKDEVDGIKFIKLDDLKKYRFAFGQDLLIDKLKDLIDE